MKSIPLRNKRKEIVAYAKVDDEDFANLGLLNWARDAYGYAVNCQYVGNYKSKSVKMHRIITNAPKGMDVDHINRDKLDNRKSNLRVCTRSENNVNQPARKDNTSGHKGVGWDKERNKWRAQVKHDGRNICIGRFERLEDAIKAYQSRAKEIYGAFLPTESQDA